MKSYLQVQRDRVKYHSHPFKNTVHRSSLTAPNLKSCDTWVSFINHFLLKRNYKSVALKLSAVDKNGILLDSVTIQIDKPIVYCLNLSNIFLNLKANNFLIDFFSEKNLFIPFPAVIITHFGKDFCNVVHSYNRVLNDIFEDDSINKNHVSEASFDLRLSKKYDTFFNLNSGISNLKNEIVSINCVKDKFKFNKKIKVSIPKLSFKSFYLSKILPKKFEGGIVKIKQPKQKLFYGRMLAGRLNKKTKSFSANHSYYDSSRIKEYFQSSESYRTYPYLKGLVNKITMYPVFSSSKLRINLKIYSQNKTFISPAINFSSNSSQSLNICVNDYINSNNLKDVTAFSLIAKSKNRKIPTRMNHQLIYGDEKKDNALQCSINLSLTNKQVFVPKHKTGFVWGQAINHNNFSSYVGFCFKSSEGQKNKIKINFYNETGKIKTLTKSLGPKKSFIVEISKLFKNSKKLEFYWYTASSKRHDLSAYSVHINEKTGNASGEHNF